MRLTLDSNILIYALFGADRRHGAAVKILERASQGDCVQTLQSLGETFRVLTRRYGMVPEDARSKIERLQRLFTIVAADEIALEKAMVAVAAHRLQFWDAMLWATARLAGCRMILTENHQGMAELEGVRFADPFRPESGPIVDRVLPKG
jgi:predicted nucleic acid-binding protein